MSRLPVVLFLAAASLAALSSDAAAQRPRASQRGTVAQTVNTTVIGVTYDRPVARGRVLFGEGGIVKSGEPWTPGANRATVIEFSEDVTVEDRPLAAGKYSLWAVPRTGAWTLIFSHAWDTFHIPFPEGQDALRVDVSPRAGAHMEALAYYFPIVGPDSTIMNIHWGELIVPVRIRVKLES